MNPENLVRVVILLFLVTASVISFIFLLVGGANWVTSGGDRGKVEEARRQITAALIGLVIILTAWAILQIMATFIGVDLSNVEL
jgi:hypothetical protein